MGAVDRSAARHSRLSSSGQAAARWGREVGDRAQDMRRTEGKAAKNAGGLHCGVQRKWDVQH